MLLPVPRSSTQLGVVLDLGLGATGAHGGHASVSEGEGDHLTALTGRKDLSEKHTESGQRHKLHV